MVEAMFIGGLIAFVFCMCFDPMDGHIDQVFGHCSSDCVAKMIGCLAHSNDDDPRRAIKQIYDASF